MATNHSVDNLDEKCFSSSIEIVEKIIKPGKNNKKAKDLFNFITKSLGILQEDGVFAFYVYLKSERDKNASQIIEEITINLLEDNINNQLSGDLEKIKSLAEDINTLLLAKSLLEKTLIYARYLARSESD